MKKTRTIIAWLLVALALLGFISIPAFAQNTQVDRYPSVPEDSTANAYLPISLEITTGVFKMRKLGIKPHILEHLNNYSIVNSADTGVADFDNLTLNDATGGIVVNWGGLRLFDTNDTMSMDWDSRQLKNEAGVEILDYSGTHVAIGGTTTSSAGKALTVKDASSAGITLERTSATTGKYSFFTRGTGDFGFYDELNSRYAINIQKADGVVELVNGFFAPNVPQRFNDIAHVKTDNSSGSQAVATATEVKLSVLVSEVEDAGNLWDGTNSQTQVLASGWYEFDLIAVGDEAMWILNLYNDTVFDTSLGQCYAQQPRWHGKFKADGTSVYDFRVSHTAGVSRNMYKANTHQWLVLRRIK